MKYIYNQTQGIGDILFLIPMAKKMVDSGHEILWPVRDDFMWIQDYIDFIEFIPQSSLNINYERYDVYNHNGYDVLPLRFANPLFRGLAKHDYSDDLHCMLDKYRIFGYDLNIWREDYIKRNREKEESLFKLINPNNDKYNLINLSWSKNQLPINKIYENLKNSYKTISMSNIEGYTLLDWIKVFENAEEIHTVSSSNLFIIEKIKIDPKKVWIYPRLPDEKNLNGIIEFVNKDFNLIIYENG